LKGEKVYWAFYPTNRNIKNLVRNLYLAMRILVSERPGVIVSSGAGVAVPFIYIGNILGIRTIYIESLTRAEDLSLSGKLIYPIADVLLVQWPQLCSKYAKAVFKGQII
jgi:UDP-N-acetylglucosamine:LPS N-acetylglucosamine transferase